MNAVVGSLTSDHSKKPNTTYPHTPQYIPRLLTVPDLPLCLCVLKHKAPLAGGHLPAKRKITMDFCLCSAILSLKAFCFVAIPDA